MAIVTGIYNTSAKTFINEAMKSYLSCNWWWIAIPVIASLITGITIDTRFLFISAMIIFLINPFVLTIVSFTHLLSDNARKHIIHRYATIDNSSITISFVNINPENEKYPLPDDDTIKLSDIKKLSYNKNQIVMTLSSKDTPFIIIPTSAFKQQMDVDSFINLIYSSANQ